jgi:hypothetical protein
MIGDLGALARAHHQFSAFSIAIYLAETAAGFLVLAAGLWGLPRAMTSTAEPTRPLTA